MMEGFPTNITNFNHRLWTCLVLFIISAIFVVSGDRTLTEGYGSKHNPSLRDFKTIWDLYLLPKLQEEYNSKITQWLDEHADRDSSESYDFVADPTDFDQAESSATRYKRIGVAGLDNLDLITKTLAQSRLPMSVNGMDSSRLRSLMQAVGKRRK